VSSPGSWWRGIAVVAQDGVPRFPAAIVECVFHGTAAIVLVVLARRGVLAGRTLAVYVAIYCVVRVALEEVRDNPAVLGGWTYYQLLAIPLFALAAVTFARRTERGSSLGHADGQCVTGQSAASLGTPEGLPRGACRGHPSDHRGPE
jgi:prolipoprotein diacylglyceryltransferase